MGRRKKGRPISGWVIVDKPVGIGSTDVVTKVRGIFQAQKAGHAGTLDPLATGVLAVALGEATKTVPMVQDGLKTYRFTVTWGGKTTTDDQEGDVIAQSDMRPSRDDIEHELTAFKGMIEQTPPQFSAIKINGTRAYDLARAGEQVDIKPRSIWIENIFIKTHERDETTFVMTCGKGGYVRAVARDLGDALGCFGHVRVLRRLSTGAFDLDQSITWDRLMSLQEEPLRDQAILPLATGLRDIPRLICAAQDTPRLLHGGAVMILPHQGALLENGAICWASDEEGAPLALGYHDSGTFQPKRILHQDAAQ